MSDSNVYALVFFGATGDLVYKKIFTSQRGLPDEAAM
jgi:glucose-6-phosphate 1-dehydrogenase